jgi:Ca-activated chloride channel family protein
VIEAAGFALLRPHWLLALPPVALAALWLARRATELSGWNRAIDPPLLAALQRLGRVLPGTPRRNLLPALTAGLIILALVGPAREVADAPTFRNLDGLVIAMDLSRSVAQGGRLPQARATARLVAERAGSRPAALVVYAGDAYLASPLTTDTRALGTTIAVLDGETVPDLGTRPERALALARRVLAQAQVVAGDIVLVSDGDRVTDAALRESEAAAAAGYRVSAIHVEPAAAVAGAPLPEGRGGLDRIARAGDGMAADVLDAERLADAIGAHPASQLASSNFAFLAWTDYGRYFLALALVPALALFRRTVT